LYEKPDVWIKPSDSVVLSVKAASVAASESFRAGYTLRFPRFKRLRLDKDWKSALSIQEFFDLKARVDEESKDKEFQIDSRRRVTKRTRKGVTIAGNGGMETAFAGLTTEIFAGLNFCILSDTVKPIKKSKVELEQLVKSNGGAIFQSPTATDNMICIADKKVVKVASLMKAGKTNIVRPKWIFDVLMQVEVDARNFLVPFEPSHMFHMTRSDEDGIMASVDAFGDSYARDLSVDELRDTMANMPKPDRRDIFDEASLLAELDDLYLEMKALKGSLFRDLHVYIASEEGPQTDTVSADISTLRPKLAEDLVRFTGGKIANDLQDDTITHVVVFGVAGPALNKLRQKIAEKIRLPRIVTVNWVEESWKEGTLLDEERYAVIG